MPLKGRCADKKAIVLHQPEEIISIGDKSCRLGFKFDWTFEWEGKQFKCTIQRECANDRVARLYGWNLEIDDFDVHPAAGI